MRELPYPDLDYLVEILVENAPDNAKYKMFPEINASDVKYGSVLKSYLGRGIYRDRAIELADNFFWTRKRMPIFLFKLPEPPFSSFEDIDEEVWNKLVEKSYRKLEIQKVTEFPQLWQVYLNRTFEEIHLVYVIKLNKWDYYVHPETLKLIKTRKIGIGCVTFAPETNLVDVRGRAINGEIAKEMLHRALALLGKPVEGVRQLKFSDPNFIRTLLHPENIEALGYLSLKFNSPNEPGVVTYSARKKNGKIEIDLRSLEEVKKKVEKVLLGGGFINNIHGELHIKDSPFEDKVSFGVNFKESLVLLFNATSENSIKKVANKVYQVWLGVSNDVQRSKKPSQKRLEDFFNIGKSL